MIVHLHMKSGKTISVRAKDAKFRRNLEGKYDHYSLSNLRAYKGEMFHSLDLSQLEAVTYEVPLRMFLPSINWSRLWPFGKKRLVLVDRGERFIQVIKEIRSQFNLPLKEAKDITDRVRDGEEVELIPPTHDKERLTEVKRALEAQGATVKIK